MVVRAYSSETGGLADSTLAMVFKVEGDEIVCIDAFATEDEALASLTRSA